MLTIFPKRRLARRAAPAAIVALLFAAIAVTTFGVPVLRPSAKDHSQPFPCQHKACGCMNAEACWRKCCCHTNAEKLAWAKQQGVTPPDYVVAAAERERASTCGGSCCSTKQSPAKVVAEEPRTPAETPKAEAAADDATTSVAIVRLEDYRACQGLDMLWLVLGQALPCRVEPVALPRPAAAEWLTVPSERGVLSVREPEPPRPKRAHV